jgi:hypothetical protein
MSYAFDEHRISVTAGSIDIQSLTCETPKVRMHIYLREKAPWVVLPDDGAARWGTMENAHLVKADGTGQSEKVEDLKIS